MRAQNSVQDLPVFFCTSDLRCWFVISSYFLFCYRSYRLLSSQVSYTRILFSVCFIHIRFYVHLFVYLRFSIAKILLKFERDMFAIINNILGHHLFLC